MSFKEKQSYLSEVYEKLGFIFIDEKGKKIWPKFGAAMKLLNTLGKEKIEEATNYLLRNEFRLGAGNINYWFALMRQPDIEGMKRYAELKKDLFSKFKMPKSFPQEDE